MLQAEWMRVCDQQPMSRIDTSRYQLDPPPVAKQADPLAWRRAVENAEAQLEHQGTRCAPAACSIVGGTLQRPSPLLPKAHRTRPASRDDHLRTSPAPNVRQAQQLGAAAKAWRQHLARAH